MPSDAQNKDNKQGLPIGMTEIDLDKKINVLMNNMDTLMMDADFDDVATLIFVRSKFDVKDTLKRKTAMAMRKSEKSELEMPEILILMLTFLFKKLGFKEDAVRTFIAAQIKEANPSASGDIDHALDVLLSPHFPN